MADIGVAVRSESTSGADHRALGIARESEQTPANGGSALRRRLVATDAFVALAAWLTAPFAPTSPERVPSEWWLIAAGFTLLTLLLCRIAGLYRARVCAVRSGESSRLAYVCGAIALLGLAGPPPLVPEGASSILVSAAVMSFFALLAGRAVFRNWLLAQRARGRRLRSVAIIGADDEASRLASYLADHPEVGYSVVGFFRSSQGQAAVPARPLLGLAVNAPSVLRDTDVNGVIVVPGAFLPSERDAVLNALVEARLHVHLATGLRSIDSRRVRSLPMGHEPLLYLEPAGASSPAYAHIKRLIDLLGATVALILAAPLLAVAAVAIKLTDGGPVVFRQERAGMGNRPFSLLKLRSMTVDAEHRLADVLDQNQRNGGPLFKADNDPRVTRVGAFLRATSFDEVPQLVNVLRGEMSLVGPRPALLREVAEFDADLLIRQRVRPGITGLWQVEARDDPSFSAYRYLDVFYVENQSLALDLAILMATVRAVAMSCARVVRKRRHPSPSHPSLAPAPEEPEMVASLQAAKLS